MKNLFLVLLLWVLGSGLSLDAQSFRPIQPEYGRGIYSAKQRAYYAFEVDYRNPGHVRVVDDVYGRLLKTIRVDSIPYAPTLSPDEQYIYFVAQYPGRIRRIHLASDQVETVLTLPDSIQSIQGLKVVPAYPDRFLLTYTGPRGSGISLFEGKKLLAQNKTAFYANNQLQVQNDSIFYVFTGEQQVLCRGVIQKDSIFLRDTFPELSTNNLGYEHYLQGDTLFTSNGIVIKLDRDSMLVLKNIVGPLPSFHNVSLSAEPSVPKFYIVENDFFQYKFTKIDKRSLVVDTVWSVKKPHSIYESYVYVTGLHEDAFILSGQYRSYLYWQCQAETPSPAIKGGPEIYACLLLDSTITIQAKDTVPEYLWSTGASTATLTFTENTTLQLQYGDQKGCLTPPSEPNLLYFVLPRTPPLVNETSSASSIQICRKQSMMLQARDFYALGYEWSTGATSQSIQVTEPGTYQVRSFDQLGCPSLWSPGTRIEVIQDTIPAKPTIQSKKGTFSFCNGEVAQLSLPPGYNYYLWQGQKTSSPTWSVSYSTSISVRVGHDARCLSDWALADVRFYPVPKQPVIQRIGNVLATNNTGETHFWYLDNELISGETGQFLTISRNGEYLVQTMANGCTSPYASSLVVQDIVTSLQGVDNMTVRVYPNPVVERLYLDGIGSTHQKWDYQIFGSDGRIKQQGAINAKQGLVVNELPGGIYVLNLWQDKQYLGLIRFIKQ